MRLLHWVIAPVWLLAAGSALAGTAITLTCSSNLTVMATSSNGATVFFTCSASGGCSPPPTIEATPPSGSWFPVGTTTVMTTAKDSCGASAHCSFTVTVITPSIALYCSSNLTVSATGSNGATVFFTCSASGGCDPPPYIVANPPSGSFFPIGTTTVTTSAGDACGTVTNCSFDVTVIARPIALYCSSNLTVSATSSNGATVFFTCSASGGCDPPPYIIANPPSGSFFPIGTTTVTTTAGDACGTLTNCSFDVTVIHPPPGLRARLDWPYPLLAVSWMEGWWQTGALNSPPVFGLEVMSPQSLGGKHNWSVFTNGFVRRINDTFLVKDSLAGGALYRLNNAATNPVFIPSAVTWGANQITKDGATLTGTATPVADNTLYWFEYGPDTNYGLASLTNSLTTATNPASLSAAIGGLALLTPYHFQLVVSDADGIQYGGDQYFTTHGLPPEVVTLDATYQTLCIDCAPTILLNGTVNGEGTYFAAYFQYGLDTNYGVNTTQFYGPANYAAQPVSATLTNSNLIPNTTYHYRLVAFNQSSEGEGTDKTFVTPSGR